MLLDLLITFSNILLYILSRFLTAYCLVIFALTRCRDETGLVVIKTNLLAGKPVNRWERPLAFEPVGFFKLNSKIL